MLKGKLSKKIQNCVASDKLVIFHLLPKFYESEESTAAKAAWLPAGA